MIRNLSEQLDHESTMRRWCLATTIADYKLRICMKCLPKRKKTKRRKLSKVRSRNKKPKTPSSQQDLRPQTLRDSRREHWDGRAWIFEKIQMEYMSSICLDNFTKSMISKTEICCALLRNYGHLCLFRITKAPLKMGHIRLLAMHMKSPSSFFRVIALMTLKTLKTERQLLVNGNEREHDNQASRISHSHEQLDGEQGRNEGASNQEKRGESDGFRNSRNPFYSLRHRNILGSLIARQYGYHMSLEGLTTIVDQVMPGVVGVEPVVQCWRSRSS